MPWPPHRQTTADLLAQAQLIPLIKDYPKNFIPPSLLDPSYIPPSTQDEMRIFALTTCVFTSVFVLARLFVRFRATAVGWDDWVIIPAYLSYLGYVYCQANYNSGIGFHAYDLAIVDIVTTLKTVYTFSLLWTSTVHLTRISILFLYLRLSSSTNSRGTRKSIISLLYFCVIFIIITICVIAFDCHPLSDTFDLKAHLTGRCHAFLHVESYYTLAAVHIALDGIVILLPIPMIKKLKISGRKKMNLYALLGVGAITMVFSGIRMFVFYGRMARGWDFTWEGTPTAIWGQAEASIALIITSLPSLNSLFLRLLPCFSRKSTTYGSRFFTSNTRSRKTATPNKLDHKLTDLSSKGSSVGHTSEVEDIDIDRDVEAHPGQRITIKHSVSVTNTQRQKMPTPPQVLPKVYAGPDGYNARAGRGSIFSNTTGSVRKTERSPCRLQHALGKRYGSWGAGGSVAGSRNESFEEIRVGDDANYIMFQKDGSRRTGSNGSQETILEKA